VEVDAYNVGRLAGKLRVGAEHQRRRRANAICRRLKIRHTCWGETSPSVWASKRPFQRV
jgi:hypothetical protein